MISIQQKMHRGDVDDNMPHPEFWWSRSAVGCLVRQPVGRRQAGTFFPGELDDIVDVDVDIDDAVDIDDDVDVYIHDEDAVDVVSPFVQLLSTAPNCQNLTFLPAQECS